MKVIFDYQIFYLQRYGGISRYFYELANALNDIKDCQPKIVAPLTSNHYLENAGHKEFIMSLNPVIKKIASTKLYDRRLKLNEYFGKKLSAKKNTILHETYYTNRFAVKAPKVITIHDMIYELFHQNSEDEKRIIAQKKQAILEADSIIAVSENTRKDLIDFYPEAKSKTSVIYHGVNTPAINPLQTFAHPIPFILHVGNRGWYKNFTTLLEVYGSDKNLNDACDIICFGGGEMSAQEAILIDKFNINHKIKFISGSDETLASLYKSALALVYISNYEGFGMPLLEAMALSCPVLSSSNSSLPEVYGTAAVAVNPHNIEDLKKALNAIAFDSELRKTLIDTGIKRAAEFTWQRCAKQTLDVYKKLI